MSDKRNTLFNLGGLRLTRPKNNNSLSNSLSNSGNNNGLRNNLNVKGNNNTGKGENMEYRLNNLIRRCINWYFNWSYLCNVATEKRRKKSFQYIISKPEDSFNLKNSEFEIADTETDEEFSYTMWIYVQNWTGGWKNILVKGSDPGMIVSDDDTVGGSTFDRYPGLWLYPDTNALHARINTLSSANEGCDVKNIPLQKWVHIGYVLNNRTVDIYIDGKLERSCVLRGIPKSNSGKLYVCGGTKGNTYFGKISKLIHFKYALKPDEIYSLYSGGPL